VSEEAPPIRVVVVDDHAAVRAGLERLLSRAEGLEPVAAIGDDRRLEHVVAEHDVDVVVLDYDLERGDGLTACLRVRQRPRPPAVVIYSGYAGPGIALAAMAAGADALVGKADPVESLLESIRAAARGEATIESPPWELRDAAFSRLCAEDLAVLAMLLERVRTDDIAETLRIDRREALRRARRVIGMLRSSRDLVGV
jgi:DNA-binding NarL/FixJ family response regulator